MKIAIIADDLTGANDSGVQFVKYGLKTSVLLDKSNELLDEDVIVFDTDSRAISPYEAYERVKTVCKYLLEEGYNFIFKKIDSTMRGNIGFEIKGLIEQVKSDFVIVTPAYPNNGRTVIDGFHYLNGVLLNETEFANDPVMPVTESHLPTLLEKQLNEKIGLLNVSDYTIDLEDLDEKLIIFKQEGIRFIVADAQKESDLEALLTASKKSNMPISWAGSAGLANYIPTLFNIERQPIKLPIETSKKAILTVIGSVNVTSRRQLKYLLENEDVNAFEVQSDLIVAGEEEQEIETNRIYEAVVESSTNGKNTVIYTAGELSDIEKAREVGQLNGLNNNQVSKEIVNAIGKLARDLIEAKIFSGLTVTGGDTLKQIAEHLEVSGFKLFGELQNGVPITQFKEMPGFYIVTKAGGFGNEKIFVEANTKLRGG